MTARAGIRWWLLAEDDRQERFALKLAPRLGLKDRPLDVQKAPDGRGAASEWVRRRYADVAKGTVRKRPSERVVLVVMIDGDNVGVSARLKMLDEALVASGQDPRGTLEPIVILVPTWSIETWLVGRLNGLSERESYKEKLRTPTATNFLQAVDRLVNLDTSEPLAALRAAHDELSRLP
jgi:hypothetical protein